MPLTAGSTIEYCLNNVDAEARRLLVARGPGVIETSCLQRCGQCFAGPFLVVDGDLIDGASHAALLARVVEWAGREECA
jgi:uncharacterized protein YuzB (UPF0349 family)